MNRRKFLLTSVASIGVIGTASWLAIPKQNKPLTINAAIEQLNALELDQIHFDSSWNAAQIFDHMAQSVEYSMSGYPSHKPEWFKLTLGVAAFSAFSTKGKMTHNLTEAIPGAPSLTNDNTKQAHQRLIAALSNFSQYKQALKPHFAFGPLSHSEYEQAHVMHIYNHLEQLKT